MGYHYRAKYEFILFFEKGKRKLNDLSIPDVLSCPRILKGYPTEKPSKLMEILLKQSSIAGEIVCDPFMGACPVGVAALENDRFFLGNDLSKESLRIATERLNSLIN
ncbi:Adenine-specific methyltransferase [Citrobacter portucalensis]|nr:Adenine-specific methyltransferase [Citrobacter portucalensis]